MKAKTLVAAGVGALTLAVGLPGAFQAQAHAAGRAVCPDGAVCLWDDNDFRPSGCYMEWRPSDGTKALPGCMVDDVGSFIAEAHACFVDTYSGGIRESHRAQPGDYSRAYEYGGKFGNRMDQIRPSC
ncbi:hypothetical protein HNP84_003210 [Thermocatellispora tengchongensis]|uniref:Peptidase inhibitor family I36 n=1 Tax=Thermocatellispora tengchongensis TaxID=1073253 RepID=A0A840NXA8_9ACTN|nr:peptidase inhibitor family I36 protein [Thermocatellispora tengchongensis]MBB5133484.1 hypothetical protein [Thermocatellispora tengchongensis]